MRFKIITEDIWNLDKLEILEDLKDDAKKYYGTTNNWFIGFYINTDGTILDGSGKKFGADGYRRTIDHREISDVFQDDIDGYDAMLAYEREGNIRLMPESQGFEIMKEPTEAQYNTIYKIARTFIDECGVDFVDNYGNNIKSLEYDRCNASKLVKDIEDFFKIKTTI